MDEFAADAFVNRDEPIPVLATQSSETSSSDTKGKRERLKESLPSATSKLKDKLQDASSGRKEYGYSLQDRLFSK